MALGKFDKYITSTDSGATVPSASVQVNIASSGLPASLFSDREGVTPITNPVAADINGRVVFYVAPNRFNMTATSGGFNVDYTDIVVVPGDAIAEQSSLLSTNVNVSQNESDISQLQSGKADTTVTDSLDQRVTAIESSGGAGQSVISDVELVVGSGSGFEVIHNFFDANTLNIPTPGEGHVKTIVNNTDGWMTQELIYDSSTPSGAKSFKWFRDGSIGGSAYWNPSANAPLARPTTDVGTNGVILESQLSWLLCLGGQGWSVNTGTIDVGALVSSIPANVEHNGFDVGFRAFGGALTINGIDFNPLGPSIGTTYTTVTVNSGGFVRLSYRVVQGGEYLIVHEMDSYNFVLS